MIHDAVQAVDRRWSTTSTGPTTTSRSSRRSTLLTDALLSHLSYEEHEIVEPLARHGFYAGQVG